ncbi:hypothetical protein [Lysobacter sp. CA196]
MAEVRKFDAPRTNVPARADRSGARDPPWPRREWPLREAFAVS